MANLRTLLRSFAVLGVVSYVVASCGGGDDRPGNIPHGTGATGGDDSSVTGGGGSGGSTGGKGGTSGTGGATGGTGASDAGKDSSADAPADVSSDGTTDAPGDGAADAEASVDATFCSNTVKDADESDVDCGGKVCPGCDTGKACTGNTDCASQKCSTTNKTCDPPLCTDGVKNGTESDKDCGGANCPKCADGKLCNSETDCASVVCSGAPKTCQVPTCTDNVKNGAEGDKDCGGTCPSKCSLGQGCKAATDCGSNVCNSNQCQCPVGMALAPATGGGSYCIDKYEVTYEQYEPFAQANPNYNNTECSWNVDPGKYTPSAAWPAPANGKKHPVRFVDWCDAWSYCKWAGKRLCGKQGGGSVGFTAYDDAAQSQWTSACTGGVSTFPYGSSYSAGACIGSNYINPDGAAYSPPLPGTRTPPNYPPQDCQGAAPGLYDMSGNVAEWEDSCDATAGASDLCHVRGGGYKEQNAQLECKANRTLARNSKLEDVGFRCCFP